jgi:hypothetical protein
LAVVAVLLALTVAAVNVGLYLYSPRLRAQVERQLEERFASEVAIRNFHVSTFPGVRAELDGLVFRHHGRTDVPPLIELAKVRARAGWISLLISRRVNVVELEGLHIRVPPRDDKKDKDRKKGAAADKKSSPVVVGKMVADGTILEIFGKKPGKPPLRFEIHQLTLREIATDRPMDFEAKLKNAKPPGLIVSKGKFGPWQKEEPGRTQVEGDYTFSNADLSDFKGIAGILSSTGKYKGVLERLQVTGETDTPDFMVNAGRHRVHLKTSFNAIVDGTNGETLLKPVRATFGDSQVVADGGVFDVEGVKGRVVRLDVRVDDGRLEDMIRFAVKGEPPMTGAIRYHAKFDLPPGEKDVVDKLQLDGQFDVQDGSMTAPKLKEKLEKLSDKAQGKPNDPTGGEVSSQFGGAFQLRDGILTLSKLTFSIPGAGIELTGTYGLRSEKLDFRGTVQLQAKLSETTTGWKSLLLKAVDPFLKGNGKKAGSLIPIRVTGTREKPSFTLDVKRAVTPGK